MDFKETISRVLGRGGNNGDDGNGEDAQAPDALELIRSDHREVEALFEIALGEGTPAAKRRDAIAKIVDALTIHAEMEEALFYPALRKAGGKDERDSVLEANEEHGVVKDLIAKIEQVGPSDETTEAKVTVLKELVQHHVKEEEGTIFGEARKALGEERLQQLGEEMQRFKERAQREGQGERDAGRGDPRYASPRTSSAKKSSAKKSAAKKPAGKKSSAKKTAAKKSTSARATSRKASGRTPARKKSATKRPSGRKKAGKKSRG
jgi:hemerythrin superfamily protein